MTKIKVEQNGKWVGVNLEKSLYSMLSNFFMVQNTGNGYSWFKKYGMDIKNTYEIFYSIMAEFIETHKVLRAFSW